MWKTALLVFVPLVWSHERRQDIGIKEKYLSESLTSVLRFEPIETRVTGDEIATGIPDSNPTSENAPEVSLQFPVLEAPGNWTQENLPAQKEGEEESGLGNATRSYPIPHQDLFTRDDDDDLPKHTRRMKGFLWQYCNAPWGLGWISKSKKANFRYPHSAGAGTYIYVVDSGVDSDHEELRGRVEMGVDTTQEFMKDVKVPERQNLEHGTHVASTIAGVKWGVAKKATIVNVKVMRDPPEVGFSAQVWAIHNGIKWAREDIVRKKRIGKAVINLSLGRVNYGNDNEACRLWNGQVENALMLDIPVVVAAGNSGVHVESTCPARVAGAITVGASNEKNERADFSNYGSGVDIFAPGVNVRGARGLTDRDELVDSGTSMSAAHVSGVVASLLADDRYTPPELHDKLWELSKKAGYKNIVLYALQIPNYLLYNGRPEE